jgi:DivIVA domain-containing protein
MTSGQHETGQQPAQGQPVEGVHPAQPERRLSPSDLHHVRFTRASMMKPGYVETEVDRVMSRVAEEMGRLIAEKGELRDQVHALLAQVEGHQAVVPPSEQAVRILSSAQLTADNYVAEAEEFSRQVTAEARAQYEEVTREARETAGAIIQAAHDAATKMGTVASAPASPGSERSVQELEEQVAYLKAFGQACRTQLRSYLEALLSDVEKEWGRADPIALPPAPSRPPAQRSGQASFVGNTVAEAPKSDADDEVVQVVAVRE